MYLLLFSFCPQFLGTVLITQQIVGQIQESIVPFLFIKRRQKQIDSAMDKSEATSEQSDSGLDSTYKKQAALEGMMEMYKVEACEQ